jgi:hypothetical protein
VIRAVRFIKEWRGKLNRDDKRDTDLTMGQRELLVMRGFAEWVDDPPKREKRQQRESAAATE